MQNPLSLVQSRLWDVYDLQYISSDVGSAHMSVEILAAHFRP